MPNSSFNQIVSKNWLLLVISIFCAVAIFIATNFFDPNRPSHTEVQHVEHLVDLERKYSIANILSVPNNNWQKRDRDLTSLGISNEVHWLGSQ